MHRLEEIMETPGFITPGWVSIGEWRGGVHAVGILRGRHVKKTNKKNTVLLGMCQDTRGPAWRHSPLFTNRERSSLS